MPVTRRSGVVAAVPADVWRTVADAHQLPRWWPRVERVEGVSGDGFTEVLRSDRGNIVRADFKFTRREKPRAVAWAQDVDGTPFAKVLRSSVTTISLEPDGEAGARVELRLDQKLQGVSRFGGFLVRRAAKRQLDEALRGLAALYPSRA